MLRQFRRDLSRQRQAVIAGNPELRERLLDELRPVAVAYRKLGSVSDSEDGCRKRRCGCIRRLMPASRSLPDREAS